MQQTALAGEHSGAQDCWPQVASISHLPSLVTVVEVSMGKVHESLVGLTPAYVIGLLADLELRVPHTQAALDAAEQVAREFGDGMQVLLAEHLAAIASHRDARARVDHIAAKLGELNSSVAVLHQEIATFRRAAEAMKNEMDNAPRGEANRQLRRERGRMLVEIEDREAAIARAREEALMLRDGLRGAERGLVEAEDRARAAAAQLDEGRAKLPAPALYLRWFEGQLGRAHCRMFLDRDLPAWREDMLVAATKLETLYGAIRQQRYRLDRHSEIVGGRAWASGEAAYAALAAGRADVAARVFDVVADDDLYFHQIFNVFRLWCLGLLLKDRQAPLRHLLAMHEHSEGLRGGYVDAFWGLLDGDASRLNAGLRELVKYEWGLHNSSQGARGLGVVNVAACALARVALERGLPVDVPAPSVPEEILLDPSSTGLRAIVKESH